MSAIEGKADISAPLHEGTGGNLPHGLGERRGPTVADPRDLLGGRPRAVIGPLGQIFLNDRSYGRRGIRISESFTHSFCPQNFLRFGQKSHAILPNLDQAVP